jgi:DtxR family Mn-dependent transcriptional regulator
MVKEKFISPSLEDYLKAIFKLQTTNQMVRVTDLAEELHVAKPSVNRAVQKLVKQNLLLHRYYGPLELTESGKKQAVILNERHQLLRYFFHKILEVDRLTAERDACALEHYISMATMDKLINYLTGLPESSDGNLRSRNQDDKA